MRVARVPGKREVEGLLMPRVPAALRETRDALILRMFIAGMSYRDIGKHGMVGLSANGVHKVVKREMAKSALRREYIADNALDVHVERLETLLSANYGKAVDTKAPTNDRVKSAELVRRIITDLTRLQQIDLSTFGTPPAGPIGGSDDDDDGEVTDLTEYRKRSGG